ncbi:MAG: hypothetical protein QNJ54_04510 [Prochloraceae cyanobacterium]|nr:hypothetical protein [Prochloraceae cyanobacterium]
MVRRSRSLQSGYCSFSGIRPYLPIFEVIGELWQCLVPNYSPAILIPDVLLLEVQIKNILINLTKSFYLPNNKF